MNDNNNVEVIAMQITDNLRIANGDNNSFILQESYISEKANTMLWRNKGYYKDVLSCLYAILYKMPIKQGDTLMTYTERFEQMYKYLYIDSIGNINSRAKIHDAKKAKKEVEENEIK